MKLNNKNRVNLKMKIRIKTKIKIKKNKIINKVNNNNIIVV